MCEIVGLRRYDRRRFLRLRGGERYDRRPGRVQPRHHFDHRASIRAVPGCGGLSRHRHPRHGDQRPSANFPVFTRVRRSCHPSGSSFLPSILPGPIRLVHGRVHPIPTCPRIGWSP